MWLLSVSQSSLDNFMKSSSNCIYELANKMACLVDQPDFTTGVSLLLYDAKLTYV